LYHNFTRARLRNKCSVRWCCDIFYIYFSYAQCKIRVGSEKGKIIFCSTPEKSATHDIHTRMLSR
jgi:hypothetical protein